MKRRTLAPVLQARAAEFPVVFLTGPRQSGKTTLARTTFPAFRYLSLEDPLVHEEARVVSELWKLFVHSGRRPPLYFWRDRTGHEVDVLIDHGSTCTPVEIKSGRTVSSDSLLGLRRYRDLTGASAGVLIHGGDDMTERSGDLIRSWRQISQRRGRGAGQGPPR